MWINVKSPEVMGWQRVCMCVVCTVAMLMCVFLKDSGLCLLVPTTSCMFVSTQAENLWCSTCVSIRTQSRRLARDWGTEGGAVREGFSDGGVGLGGGGGGGTAVVWMSCGRKYVSRLCSFMPGMCRQPSRLRVIHYSPDAVLAMQFGLNWAPAPLEFSRH